MDIFEACERIQEAPSGVPDASLPWDERLAGLRLPGLPPALGDALLPRFRALYGALGTGNLVRDVLCNLGVQTWSYRLGPWGRTAAALNFQVGGISSSSFPASCVYSLRTAGMLLLRERDEGTEQREAERVRLAALMQALAQQGLTAQAFIRSAGAPLIAESYAFMGDTPFGVVHFADLVSAEEAMSAFTTARPGMIQDALVLFSGPPDIIRRIGEQLSGIANDTRSIDTLTMQAGQPDRTEALLLARIPAPSLPGRQWLRNGAVHDDAMGKLRASNPHIHSIDTWPAIDSLLDPRTMGVWSAADGSTFPHQAVCFASQGFDRTASRYAPDFADAPIRDQLGIPLERWRKPFGRIASLPNGCLVNRIVVRADGTIPDEAVLLPLPADTAAWPWQTAIPQGPLEQLVGTWIYQPRSGEAFSHWLLEDFLMLATLAELGMLPNLLLRQKLQGYQRIYLHLAGLITAGVIADPKRVYMCERLLCGARETTPHAIHSFIRVHHPLAARRIDIMLERAGVKDRRRREKLYVSRMDSRSYRACLNEEQVIQRLEQRGYRVINGTSVSPVEALSVYGNARVIVGPLGAGLQNAIFAPRGCQIVAFMARPYFEEGLEQTSHLMGHDYAYLVCDYLHADDWGEGGARNSNFVVDMAALDALVDEAETRANAYPE